MNRRILALLAFVYLAATFVSAGSAARDYHVLQPVTKGNLSIFPIVGGSEENTAQLLSLDEGVRSGQVVVAEAGSLQGLVRSGSPNWRPSGAEVNRLMLVNNSERPLLLLAGEVVTGGKQDRVIGLDSIVPPHSGPIDLSVFCVEHGRWVAASDHFGTMKLQMAQPSVRLPAMATRDQQRVWDTVSSAVGAMALAAPPASASLRASTSYAKAMQNPEVEKNVAALAADYDELWRELRKVGAKGVVVSINGRITWADVFASTNLLQKYWQKLIRSYAADSLTTVSTGGHTNQKQAQLFLDQLQGTREVTETKPGLFRRTETSGDGYKVFALTSLLPKYEYTIHLAKMAFSDSRWEEVKPVPMVR